MRYYSIGNIPSFRRLEIVNMPRPRKILDMNELRRLRDEGQGIHFLAKHFQVASITITAHLHSLGR